MNNILHFLYNCFSKSGGYFIYEAYLNSELTPVYPSAKLPRCSRVRDGKVRIRCVCWVDGIQHTASSTLLRDPGVNWKKVSLRTRNSRATWKSNKEKRGRKLQPQKLRGRRAHGVVQVIYS